MSKAVVLKLFSALLFSLFPTLIFATGKSSSYALTDGIYRVQSPHSPSPIVVLQEGKVINAFGEISDPGCLTLKAGSLQQSFNLQSLLDEDNRYEQLEQSLSRRSWHSGQWNGANPFAFSKLDIEMNNEADLHLIHTVTTYVVNSNAAGTTLCNRRHHYIATRIDQHTGTESSNQ